MNEYVKVAYKDLLRGCRFGKIGWRIVYWINETEECGPANDEYPLFYLFKLNDKVPTYVIRWLS